MGTVSNPDPKRRGLVSKLGSPVVLNGGQLSALQTELRRPENIGSGVKFCGGFVPAIAVVFQGDDFSLELQFCFLCDEMKVDLNGEYVKMVPIDPGHAAFLGFFKGVFPADTLIQSLPLRDSPADGKQAK
jgi:hypothetical protein